MYTWLKSKTDNVTEILADNKKLVSFTSLTPSPPSASPASKRKPLLIIALFLF